jgi:hypothetical protein
LIRGAPHCHNGVAGKGIFMTSGAGVRLAAIFVVLVVEGCSSAGSAGSAACQCPQPVHYDDAMIEKITAALRVLPPDNVLQQAMADYEDERDALRICLGR